jgi:hypothetical protein
MSLVSSRCSIALVLASCVTVLVNSACDRNSAPPVTAPISVNELMVELIDPTAHELWDREIDERAPRSDADWNQVQHSAVQLIAATVTVANGGTGTQDATWAVSPDWKRFAQDLMKASMNIRAAAQQRSVEALVTANGEVVQACENCHKAFKPAVPTEGRSHKPH